jgi:hypothetical protein
MDTAFPTATNMPFSILVFFAAVKRSVKIFFSAALPDGMLLLRVLHAAGGADVVGGRGGFGLVWGTYLIYKNHGERQNLPFPVIFFVCFLLVFPYIY